MARTEFDKLVDKSIDQHNLLSLEEIAHNTKPTSKLDMLKGFCYFFYLELYCKRFNKQQYEIYQKAIEYNNRITEDKKRLRKLNEARKFI